MSVLESRDLTKIYSGKKAVDHVDMHIDQGDIYGFVGENGAGKTTIIRLITGLIRPSEGSFKLFDVENTSSKFSAVRKGVSAVVEAPSVYLNMNAMDNLRTQCMVLGIEPKNLNTYLSKVGLEDVINMKKKAKNFSLGMRQRLGIAMALLGSPQFIILDEPMNGLDPTGIVEMRDLIHKLNEEGVTFLISSHILDELSKVATKYGFISHGKLIREMTAEELHKEAKHCIELTVNDSKLAMDALRAGNAALELEAVSDKVLRVYNDISATELFAILSPTGVNVENVFNKEENIEEFYIKMIGGGQNV